MLQLERGMRVSYSFSNVVVVSILDLENEGNRASSPRRDWPWVNSFPQYDLRTVEDREVRDRIVILGGGALLDRQYKSQLDMIADKAKEIYLWGVGINSPGVEFDDVPLGWDIVQKASLVGLRDNVRSGDVEVWNVGCPSVMHPIFAHPPESKIQAIAYVHEGYELDLPKVKQITTSADIDEALFHIGRAKIVFTTSFHGAMWGAWLGKQVVLLDPRSSKFHTGLKSEAIHFASPTTLEPNLIGRDWYASVIRSHREFERFIGSKITIEPI